MKAYRPIVAVLLLAALALSPLAGANWKDRGTNEPDTVYDHPFMMWSDPDTQWGDRIYFNVFPSIASEVDGNPNVALTGSRVQPATVAFSAHLGIWKDCNGDKYIGNGEAGVSEYRIEVLQAQARSDPSIASICPVEDPRGQTVYPHNDGTWIRELIPLGPTENMQGFPSREPTAFYAEETLVWGDFGLPTDPPRPAPAGGRVASDHVFTFTAEQKDFGGLAPCRRTTTGAMEGGAHGVLGYCPPTDLGLGRGKAELATGWHTGPMRILGPQAVQTSGLPAEPQYLTFYASVGWNAFAAGLRTPGGGASAVYGQDVCGNLKSGVVNGWNCDGNAWKQQCTSAGVPQAACPYLGRTYHMRDIDCWDGTLLRGSDIRASLTDLSTSGPCQDSPANKQDIS